MGEKRAALGRLPLFADLEDGELARVVALVRHQHYRRGEFLLLEGEPCQAVHFVIRGRVRVSKVSSEGREQVLALLGPGEGLNLVPVFDGAPNPASAQALTEVEVVTLTAADLLSLIEDIPHVARNILGDFARKLRLLVDLVEDLSFRTVGARLARFLLSEEIALVADRRWTQEEIAARLGTVREMVGRVLRAWHDEGLIRLERGQILILNRALLAEKALP